MINVRVNGLYDKVNITRRIQLLSSKIIDKIEVNHYNSKNIDYFFHCDATLISKLDYNVMESFKEYSYLENIKEIINKDDSITLKWKLNDKAIISKIELSNKQLFICDSPNNRNIKERTTFIIRSNNEKKSIFKIEWKVIN